jgi:hypothetical protein
MEVIHQRVGAIERKDVIKKLKGETDEGTCDL